MRRRATCGLAGVVVAIVVVCGLAIPASSTATAAATGGAMTASTTAAGTPAPEFCRAFGDYYDAAFLVQFVTAFAQALSKKAVAKTRTTLLLVLSPKFQELTAAMATTASKTLRPAFRRQAAKFATGIKILRAAGLTSDQITALAESPLHTNSATQDNLLGKANLSKKKLNAATGRVQEGRAPRSIPTRPSPPRSGTGSAPTRSRAACSPTRPVNCGTLLTPSDLAETAGAGAVPQTVARAAGGRGPTDRTATPFGIGVDVDRGTLAYDHLVAAGLGCETRAGRG